MAKRQDAKTTLRLEPAIHKRLRHLAIERGTTFGALVTRALAEFLKRETGTRERRRVRR
jgi:predicted transcriptional regulator